MQNPDVQGAAAQFQTALLFIRAAIPLLFALAAVRLFWSFLAELRKGDQLQIVSHWGGLGGGLGGWRISNTVALLLGAFLFTGASVYLADSLNDSLQPKDVNNGKTASSGGTSGSQTGGKPPGGAGKQDNSEEGEAADPAQESGDQSKNVQGKEKS